MIRKIALLISCVTLSLFIHAQTDTLENLLENYRDSNFTAVRQVANDYYATRDHGRGTGYKQWKRHEYFVAPRLGPSGRRMNLTAKRYQEIKNYESRRAAVADEANWEFVGPTDVTLGSGWSSGVGRVNVVAFHPTDPNQIFVGCYGGGIWKTTNGGSSWQCISDDLPIQSFTGLEISKANPSIMYALSGAGFTSVWSLGAERGTMGVFKSINGGQDWFQTAFALSDSARVKSFDLEMHPTNSQMLFALTDLGIHKSDNGGVSWDYVYSTRRCYELVFHPTDSMVMYASDFNRSATRRAQILRSTDAGETWVPLASPLFPVSTTRIALAVSPVLHNTLLAMFGDNPGFEGLYYSIDQGTSWIVLNNTAPDILGSNIGGGGNSQAHRNNRLAWNPADVSKVIFGGINVWRSSNSGQTIVQSSHWNQDSLGWEYTHADINDLQYNPLSGNLYCASDGGLYVSADDGVNWTDITSGLGISTFYGISTTSQDYDLVYGGLQDNGCNRWDDDVFTQVRGADGMICRISPDSLNVIYTCRQEGWIERSDDGGQTFVVANPKGNATETYDNWVTPYVLDLKRPDTIFAGYSNVWRSYDKGASWTQIFTGFNDIRAVAHAPSNVNRLYVGMAGGIWRTTNVHAASPTWSTLSSGLPFSTATLSDIVVEPTNSNTAYVCFSGYTPGEKVYQTIDGGQNWTNISGTLPNLPVNTIVRDPFGGVGTLYIGTDNGVFYRDAGMTDWEPFSMGLPSTIIMDLEINNEYNIITAGTYGRGIYRSTLHNGCLDFYALTEATNPNPAGTQVYKANNYIFSNRVYQGTATTNVTYQCAGNTVLGDGFRMPQQGTLIVKTANCED